MFDRFIHDYNLSSYCPTIAMCLIDEDSLVPRLGIARVRDHSARARAATLAAFSDCKSLRLKTQAHRS